MVDFGNGAKMRRLLEHIPRFIIIAAHTNRAVISVYAVRAFREITPRDGAHLQGFRGLGPTPLEIMLITTTPVDAAEGCVVGISFIKEP